MEALQLTFLRTFLEKEKYQKIFALPGRGKGKSKDAASSHYGFRASHSTDATTVQNAASLRSRRAI